MMTKKPYIGLFNDSYPPILDGVATALVNYADYLHQHSGNPCIVTPANPGSSPSVDYPVVRYFSIPIINRHPYRYGYPRLDFSIKNRLNKIPFSLVHSHSPFSSGRLARYVARKQGVPLIGTFHSKYRTDLEHSLRHVPFLINHIVKKIIKFYNSCDQVWIPQASVEETIREYGYKGEVTVVENGNDLATIPIEQLPSYKIESRKLLGIPPDEINFLFVGQHIWEKGIGIILDAAKILHEKGVKLHLHYVGTGYASSALAAKVRETGLESVVSQHGMIYERDKLTRLYAAADLFLFPSFYDNAPIVIREAAALGTPSVLLHGATAGEVITDGDNGYLCNRTPESYSELIYALLSRRDDIMRVGLRARATLSRSWEDVMHEVTDRYNDIIKNARH